MATNKDLKWQITEQDHPEWVKFLDSGGSLVSSISGEGDTQLNITIDETIGDPAETAGTITVTCTSCKEQKQRQISVCRCTCNCDRLSIVWEIDTINQTGMSSNTRIGTYTINGACTEDNISARIKKRGSSGTGTALSLSNGIITTTRKISANTTPDEIYYDITVAIKNGDACDRLSHEMRQEGITCDCNSFEFSDFITTVPQEGILAGNSIFKSVPTVDCPVEGIVGTIKVGNVTHTLVRASNGNMNLQEAITANTNTDSINVVIKASYNGTNCESATRNISQPGTGCGCGTIITSGSINITIPRGGVAGGNEIGTYRKASSLCSDNDITGTLTNGGNTYNLTFSDNKIYLQNGQTIGENSDTEDKTFAFKLFYQGGECTAFRKNVDQPGTGCGCGNLTSVSFDTIPTEGVTAQTVIGSYEIQGDCEFTVTSSTLSLSTDNNHNIITNNDIAATTDPTGKTFSVDVMFNGSRCSACTVTQRGAECTCLSSELSVDYLSVLEDGVPQTGLTAGTRILTYSINNSCPSNKIRITLSYPGGVTQELNLRNGSGYLSSDIDETGGRRNITVNVYYDDTECTSLRGDFTQEGLSCSCESFIAPESDWAVLPYGGTIHQQNKWVVVATGDTGIYTSTGVLAGICGSLSGRSDDNYLVEDETTGEKIKTAVLPPTAEEAAAGYTQGHIYEFSACVDDIHVLDPSASGRRRVIIEFWYTPYESGGETCKGQTGFWIDDNVCDCNDTPFLTISDVPCEGTGDEIIELGRIDASEIGGSMEIKATLVGADPLIEDFSYETDNSGNFIIKGKVNSTNTGERRQVGAVQLEYVCQKGTPYQWVCNPKSSFIYQAQCESCSCNDESLMENLKESYVIDFPQTKTTGETYICTLPKVDGEIKNCIDLYIEGADEETGIYDGGWFTAHIYKYLPYSYYLAYELTNEEHGNREATMNIKVHYKSSPFVDWQDCSTHQVTIRDTICDCAAALRAMECFMGDSNEILIKANTGSRYAYSDLIYFYADYDENCHSASEERLNTDCFRLCVLTEDNVITGCTSSNAYTDPGEYFEIHGTVYNSYCERIDVEVLKDFDEDKYVNMVLTKLSSNGEWERCSEDTYTVHIQQESCSCDEFKDKVHITADTFVYTESYSSPVRIRRAQVYTGCGDGELYVKGADGQYYNIGAKDDPNFPNYITNMTSGCNSSYLNWVEVYVKSLTEEGQTRSTDFAIYRCTSDGVDEDCYVDFTINEEFVIDCSKKSCTNDYTLGLTWVCGSSAQNPCTIPYTGNIGNPMKIGEYNTPTGDCFTVELDPHNPMVQNIDLRDNGSGKTEIYIECNANQTTGPSSISIDINVYHIYEENGETVKETCTNQYQTIAVTVEAPPTE